MIVALLSPASPAMAHGETATPDSFTFKMIEEAAPKRARQKAAGEEAAAERARQKAASDNAIQWYKQRVGWINACTGQQKYKYYQSWQSWVRREG